MEEPIELPRFDVYCPWCNAVIGTAAKRGSGVQTFVDGPDCRHDWTIWVFVGEVA